MKESSISNSNIGNSFMAGCLKILIGHFQIMPLIKKINFPWENYIYTFFNVQSYFGNSSEAVSSMDCLMKSINV